VLIRDAVVWIAGAELLSEEAVAELPQSDVRLADGLIAEVGPGLRAAPGEDVIDADGGMLLPGLHDHHVHLRALAAASASVAAGPPLVSDAAGLAAALRAADAELAPGAWLRAVGYHESVAGELDREALDRLLPHRPVRVQHRTGALWMVNSLAVARLGLDDSALGSAGRARVAGAGVEGAGVEGAGAERAGAENDSAERDGVERDGAGRPTGRLWRMDRWLAERVTGAGGDLGAVSSKALSFGITGFTDATPGATERDLATLAEEPLAQRLYCMAPAGVSAPGGTATGPEKVLLDDDTLPSLDQLAGRIRGAHEDGRPVAVHCVTRVQLVLTLVALHVAGRHPGDRIEHGAVIAAGSLADLRGLTVVTQPHFVVERGGQYAADVPAQDRPDLWRLRSLIDAGVSVAAGTDAPFGGADPWHVMRAAVRRPPLFDAREAVSPASALGLFLGEPASPGVPRLVARGRAADLVLLRAGPREALHSLSSDLVAATLVGGAVSYAGR
jgi:predicted amidohydrolase YtcJ